MARSKALKTFKTNYVGIEIESNMTEALNRLEQGIAEKVLRSGAYAGANVFYNEMRTRAPVDQGTLRDAIYQWHDNKRSTPQQQIYMVGPNKSKAPHWHLVEYGHWRVNKVFLRGGQWIPTKQRLPAPKWVPAIPYIRPTFDARVNSSLSMMRSRMRERLSELMSEVATT